MSNARTLQKLIDAATKKNFASAAPFTTFEGAGSAEESIRDLLIDSTLSGDREIRAMAAGLSQHQAALASELVPVTDDEGHTIGFLPVSEIAI